MKPVAVLPALCTLGNAFCGFLAIAKGADAITELWRAKIPTEATPDALASFHHLFATSCWLIFLANVFDALDGRLARMTKMTSEFGAMLDSLSDMLTFGAAPAFLVKFLFEMERRLATETLRPKVVLMLCFLYVCCAALRLARFTTETDDDPEAHDFFKGLPSPAAAGFVASSILLYIHFAEDDAPAWIRDHRHGLLTALLASLPLLALLMVSRVRYVHIVNRYMRGRHPYTYLVPIVLALLLLWIIPEYALALLCMGYVIVCPVIDLLERLTKRPIWPLRAPGPNGEAP